MSFIAHFLGSVFAILCAAYLIPGFAVSSFYIALIIAVLLGILNITIKPILTLLTLPLTIITLGLFWFVLNALVLLFLASFVDGFTITGFIPAFLGGIVIAIVNWIVHKLV